ASFVASVALSLVNPFTYHVYLEAWHHFANPLLPAVIEWVPPNFTEILGLLFVAYTVILALGFATRRQLADLPTLMVALMTFYLAVSSRRHVPVFLVLTLPYFASFIASIRLRVIGIARTSLAVGAMIAIFSVAVFLKWPEYQAMWRDPAQAYCAYGPHCTQGLVKYLVQHPPVGRGVNFYDWGGYLIGNGVPAKLFIDGRMHLWEQGNVRPMEAYMLMFRRFDLDEFERYKFDWVLVPRGSDFAKAFAAYRSPWTGKT